MLNVDDGKWTALPQAPGATADLPALLRELADFPADGQGEPYSSLSRALLRQGSIYPAAYAVLPHLVHMIEAAPARVPAEALLLLVRIEIARVRGNGPQLDPELATDYKAALERLPQALAAMAGRHWDEFLTRTAAAALAVAKGQAELADAILALSPGRVPDFMDTIGDDE